MVNQFFGNQNNLICDFLIGNKTSFSIQPCHIAEHYDEQIGNVKESYEIPQKLTIRIDLGIPSLVTNLRIIMAEQDAAEKKFILLDILGNQLGDNTEFQRLLRLDQTNEIVTTDPTNNMSISLKGTQMQKVKNQLKIQAYGVTKVLQISFLINKSEFYQSSQDQSEDGSVVMHQESNYEKKIDLETGSEEFKKLFDSIQVYGYSLFHSPSQNQGIQLLNISNLFIKNNRKDESIETDIILGYSLMSQRKYIQAAEIFKRSSLYFYRQYEQNSQKKLGAQDNQQFSQYQYELSKPLVFSPSRNADGIEDTFNQSNLFGSTNFQGGGTSNQKLLRAAKLELLVADCIKQPHMLNQKVQAYQRATEYFQGQRVAINLCQQNADSYTNILILCPYLCKFLLRTLDERIDPLRVSAIKGIEFLIDNLGCTISNQLPQILKQVILTYPLIPACSLEPNGQFDDEDYEDEDEEEENEELQDRYEDGNYFEIDNDPMEDDGGFGHNRVSRKSKKSKKFGGKLIKSLQTQNSINQRVIFDMYHHLLDQFLNLLASASSQILRSIFNDVISTQLFNNEVAHDVKIYLCKITDKIIGICQGDLTITPAFIQNMMHYLLNAHQQQQFTNQFKQHLERTWDNIKSKLLSNLELTQANRIVDLISENLQQILDNQGEAAHPSPARDQQIDSDIEFNFWIEITSIVIQREKRTQENLPNNFSRYSKKLELSQENLNLRILIHPFLQILELTIAHPQSIETFKLIWSILVDILTSPSAKQQTDYTLSNVTYSILNKTKSYIANHPPPLLQLSALIIIISTLPPKEIDVVLKKELYELLFIFLGYVPHSLYEETFFLVDCLIDKIDTLDQNLIELTLVSLIDQYTMKNKAQKKIVSNFISKLMKQDSQTKSINYFSWILEICLVKNVEPIKDDLFYSFGGFQNENVHTKNKNILQKGRQTKKNADSKQFEKQYDLFIDKISFLQDCLDQLKQVHFVALICKNQDSLIAESIIKLINSGDSRVRLKGFSIIKKIHKHFVELQETQVRQLEKVLNNYISASSQSKLNQNVSSFQEEWFHTSKQDSDKKSTQVTKNQSKVNTSISSKLEQSNIVEIASKSSQQDEDSKKQKKKIFSYAKIMITRLIIACLKASFENLKDPKQQFNSLVLMDQFFQNLFGGPDLESELKFSSHQPNLSKNTKNQKKIQIIDLETYEFTLDQYFEYNSEWYLHMRLNQILKLWPLLQNLVNSPWSNIRSLTYGVICNWVRADLNHYKSSSQKKFLQILFRLLLSLLQSKESECRTGGLNILGSLCGLSYNFNEKGDELKKYLHFFRRHENLISLSIWETVYDIQSDWDVTNQAAAMIIIQICAPRDSIKHFFRLKQEDASMRHNYHQHSQNQGFSHLTSKENRSVTPTYFQGKDDDQMLFNDSGIMNKSQKQNSNSNYQMQFMGNNEQSPKGGLFNPAGEGEEGQSHLYHNNVSNDSIGGENNPVIQSEEVTSDNNLDANDSQNGTDESNRNQDDLFWFDSVSEKEIRDMISMFRGEEKPPVTLWIERDTYNTEHKPEGTTITEVVTYTMNEEEDAGIYGYFDDVGLTNNANSNSTSNNNNNNLSGATEEYIQEQQQQFQQMKKQNTKGLDLLQERIPKDQSKQDNNAQSLEQSIVVQQIYEGKKEQYLIKKQLINQQQNQTGQSTSNPKQTDDLKQKQKFNQFDDEDLDYDKLGIIEMEDDEEEFIDDYERTYLEYKNAKNPSTSQNQKVATDANRPSTSKVPQKNVSIKQPQQIYQQIDSQNSNIINNQIKNSNVDAPFNDEKGQKQQQVQHDLKKPQSDSNGKYGFDLNKGIQKNEINKEEQKVMLNNNDALTQYKQQSPQQVIKNTNNQKNNANKNSEMQRNKIDSNSKDNQYIYEDNDDFEEEDDEEEIEEDIDEEYNDQPDFNQDKRDNTNLQDFKYDGFKKMTPKNVNEISKNQKSDNSRYAQIYKNQEKGDKSYSGQSSQQQNSSGKRLNEELQSFANSNASEGDGQKQVLFNQRMHFREAILSDENKESLSYTQSSQPNQKRRDTFEVTLSFSDSSIFRDENTDKTLTKEDEQNPMQQQLFNAKLSENNNYIISETGQVLTPQNNFSKAQNNNNNNNNKPLNHQANVQQEQDHYQTLPKQNIKKQHNIPNQGEQNIHQQPVVNNFFNNISPNQNQSQNKQVQQQNDYGVQKKNAGFNNTVNIVKSPSPSSQVRSNKTPLHFQNNENQNLLNKTSPITSSHQKSQEKPSLPPNNTPRLNLQSKSPINNAQNNQDLNSINAQTHPLQGYYLNSNLQKSPGGIINQIIEQNNSGKKQKNQSFSPSDNVGTSQQKQQQSPFRQQGDQQRQNYHHGKQFENENAQKQLLNQIQQQVQNQQHKQTQGGSKSPSQLNNLQDKKIHKKSPTSNQKTKNQLLNHLLNNPASTKSSNSAEKDQKSKSKSKSRSKEKNQQNQLQLYHAFQNNLELNILQGQEFVVASSTSSKSQGKSQKVDFFKNKTPQQSISNSHSPYQTMTHTIGGFSSTKHQKSVSKSRSKSNGKKKCGLKASSVTPNGFFKNRTPSNSPPTSSGKNGTGGQLRLQGSCSGGKSRSFEKNTSSNLSSTFNNTITSLINGSNTINPNKPPLKTGNASGSQSISHTTNKNNLNLHSIDKLYKTDFLSRLLDSTKSNVSSKKASNITPKSCKTKISSSRNSRSKENNSTMQNNNSQSYYSNQNNINSQTINSQSYNQNSNSNFSFAHPQKEGGSPPQSAHFDDEPHQSFSYDETVFGNVGGGCGESSKNCTLDFTDELQNIYSQQQLPLKAQQSNSQQIYIPPHAIYNNFMNEQAQQQQQQVLLAQIAINNNQKINKKMQGLHLQHPFLQNNPLGASSSAQSSRRGSEGSCLPFSQNIDLQHNNSFHPHMQQNFMIPQEHLRVQPNQNNIKKGGGGANKENYFDNPTDELLDVLTKQRNQRSSSSSKQKKRSTSGGKSSSNQVSINSKNAKQSSNPAANRGKLLNSSFQGSDKNNKFQPYKQPLSPNHKKRVSPNSRPQSNLSNNFIQQKEIQQLSASSFINTHHFSSTSQDSTSYQSQIKNNFNQTSQHQTSHNTSFQSYNKPPLVRKQLQNSKEKEVNMQNSGTFVGGNVPQQSNTQNIQNVQNMQNSNFNNQMQYQQEIKQNETRQRKKIQFEQNQSFDDTLVNTTL